MRISDWSSDVCSSDLVAGDVGNQIGFVGQCVDPREQVLAVEFARHRLGIADEMEIIVGEARTRDTIGSDEQIGRASCRERVWPYVEISEVAVPFKQKRKTCKTNSGEHIKLYTR